MNPRVVGVAATVAVVGLIGIGVLAGLKPRAGASVPRGAAGVADKAVEERPAAQPGRPAAGAALCATCGTVETVRTFEVNGAASAESDSRRRIVYRVTIRMEDGSYRTISLPAAPGYGAGEKVRIIDGSVVPQG